MKLIEKVQAYRVLNEIMKENWSFSFIYPLVHLMREIKGDYDFFCREEMKLVARFGKKEADGTVLIDEKGCFCFPDEENQQKYQRCHFDLENTQAVDLPLISLPHPENMRGEWLNALLPFCSFEQEEKIDEPFA